ncbi:ABC transporter substrate-binding protein [Aerococcus urinae]|uniref:taurine ABC transporter substrate-binding protein n=1 Tax=Aerococcus TaxID=1375 RepID=UPI00227A9488|nr:MULTISPECIES: ABC transporter substrate-binding protein [Aerococcus]MCY3036169.1 ABC transporter substrate-binding protein [Aerococcus sp. Group 2]MDK6520183.1 ABC transporter substrate-binding protein [Aerococcus urinae]
MARRRQWIKIAIGVFIVVGLLISGWHYGLFDRDADSGAHEVRIAYLRVPNDELLAKSQDTLEDKLAEIGVKAKFVEFDSGVEANKALASGSIDYASMGITNAVVALAKQIPTELIWIHELLGETEGLVVKDSINSLSDLAGQRVATTFASTSHYSLEKVLEAANLSGQVKLIDMKSTDIAASWASGDIVGAYTWEPNLSQLVSQSGHVLLDSKALQDQGIMTANVMLGRKAYLEDHPKVTQAIIQSLEEAHQLYASQPDQAANSLGKELGMPADEVLKQMRGSKWLRARDQVQSDYLGSSEKKGQLVQVIQSIADFLSSNGQLSDEPSQKAIEDFLRPSDIERYLDKER